jgi:diaminohydroxyphosphoribosylaminopyrimidine deaminase/5-amino-6-(5-phosphoribosylamino)uracil reductase
MARAMTLARRGAGRTSPNPMVGCVIVKAGKVIGEGWHKVYGGPHAEVNALAQAGADAAGATMYVTLEPCAHHGRTPPCVEAVIAAGFKRIVVAMRDPNPLTNGKSLAKMRHNGIAVDVGVGEAQAREMNAAFIKYMTQKMPYVVGKIAQTMDGKAGVRGEKTCWITTPATRAAARALRSGFDAIVAGIGTVLADDPRLEAPGKAIVKVIVDSRLRLPLTSRLFKGVQPGQVIVAVTAFAPAARIRRFRDKGIQVMVCRARAGRVDLEALFKELAKNGLIRILIEGGPSVLGAALKAGMVDRLHLYLAPRIMTGVKPCDEVRGLDVAGLLEAGRIDVLSCHSSGRDVLVVFDVIKEGEGLSVCSPGLSKRRPRSGRL